MINIFIICALVLTMYLGFRFPKYAAILLSLILPTYLIRLSLNAGNFEIPTTYLELSVWLVFLIFLFNSRTRSALLLFVQQLPPVFRWGAICFVGAAIFSTYVSPHTQTSLGILKGWIITPFIAAWVIASTIHKEDDRKNIVYALITSATAMSVWAMLYNPHTRWTGVYDVPNSLALFITPLLVASVWQFFSEITPRRKTFLFLSSVCMSIALLGAQSLGGIAAVLLVLSGVAVTHPVRRVKKSLATTLVVGLVIVLVTMWQVGKLPYILKPFLSPTEKNSLSVRLQLWSIGKDLIYQHPIKGIGLGVFEPLYQNELHKRFRDPDLHPLPEFVFRDPHNWIISFWLNTGVVGLVSFILINIVTFMEGYRKGSHTNKAFILIIVTSLLFGLTDTIFWKNDLALLYTLSIFCIYPLNVKMVPSIERRGLD